MPSSGELGASEPWSVGVVEATLESFLIQGANFAHLCLGESKVEELRVDLDTRSSDRLGDDNSRTLDSPSEQDLSGSLTLLVGDPVDNLILHERSRLVLGGHDIARRSERSVGSHYDTVFITVVDQRVSLEVRLGLELVHSNGLLGNFLDSFNISNFMVRESDVSA